MTSVSQSIQAMAPSMIGDPLMPACHDTSTKRSSTPFLAKRQQAAPWWAPSTLTQNLPKGAIAAHVSLIFCGKNPTSGGSSETDVNDPMVKPAGMSPAIPVIIVTPVGKCPSTLRKWLGSKSTGSSDIEHDLTVASWGSMSDPKRELRTTMRRRRAAIDDRPSRSQRLTQRVLERVPRLTDGRSRLVVLAFVGVGSEPDTVELIEGLAARGHTVLLPRIENGEIIPVRWAPAGPMATGAFGIPAPEGPPIAASTVDVVVVPGLAFTPDGRRLGQGGGFYDRFLPLVRDDCITIGIGFAEQIVDDLPTEPHDRILDVIVTDAVPE